jgi:hypothetical protein
MIPLLVVLPVTIALLRTRRNRPRRRTDEQRDELASSEPLLSQGGRKPIYSLQNARDFSASKRKPRLSGAAKLEERRRNGDHQFVS